MCLLSLSYVGFSFSVVVVFFLAAPADVYSWLVKLTRRASAILFSVQSSIKRFSRLFLLRLPFFLRCNQKVKREGG